MFGEIFCNIIYINRYEIMINMSDGEHHFEFVVDVGAL